jgi:hypothetical protein
MCAPAHSEIANEHLFLEVTGLMLARTGRLDKRFDVAVPVLIASLETPGLSEQTVTQNVSIHGIRVLTHRPLGREERFLVNSVGSDVHTQAKVVYCQPLSDGVFGVGLQFKDSPPGDLKQLVD